MRVACNLRKLRGEKTLAEMQRASGINAGTLSAIERGVLLPLDKQLEPIERAYGAGYDQWYPRRVFAAIAVGHDKDEAA